MLFWRGGHVFPCAWDPHFIMSSVQNTTSVVLASFLSHPLSPFWVIKEFSACCYENYSPQRHHLNLAASWRNTETALLSSCDNAALENTTRNSCLDTYEFPAHAGKPALCNLSHEQSAKERWIQRLLSMDAKLRCLQSWRLNSNLTRNGNLFPSQVQQLKGFFMPETSFFLSHSHV